MLNTLIRNFALSKVFALIGVAFCASPCSYLSREETYALNYQLNFCGIFELSEDTYLQLAQLTEYGFFSKLNLNCWAVSDARASCRHWQILNPEEPKSSSSELLLLLSSSYSYCKLVGGMAAGTSAVCSANASIFCCPAVASCTKFMFQCNIL